MALSGRLARDRDRIKAIKLKVAPLLENGRITFQSAPGVDVPNLIDLPCRVLPTTNPGAEAGDSTRGVSVRLRRDVLPDTLPEIKRGWRAVVVYNEITMTRGVQPLQSDDSVGALYRVEFEGS